MSLRMSELGEMQGLGGLDSFLGFGAPGETKYESFRLRLHSGRMVTPAALFIGTRPSDFRGDLW